MIWIILFELIVLFALFFWLPVMRHESFFAVHVSREYFTGDGKKLLLQYWIALGIAFALHVATLFMVADPKPIFLIALVLTQLMIYPLIHYGFHFRVKPHRIIIEHAKTVASLQSRNLLDYTNILIEAVIAFLILMPVLVLIYFYPQLPESIPSHWNFAGKPDHWVPRSWSKIALFPALALWLHGTLFVVKISFLQTKITLPAQKTADYFALKEKSLHLSLRCVDALRLSVGVVLAIVPLNVIISGIPAYKFLEPFSAITLWTCAGATIITTFFFIARVIQINTKLDELVRTSETFSASSDVGWIGGGAFYYNPDDPALFVEKKVGIGNTINFANQQAKYFLLYFVGGGGILFFLAIANF